MNNLFADSDDLAVADVIILHVADRMQLTVEQVNLALDNYPLGQAEVRRFGQTCIDSPDNRYAEIRLETGIRLTVALVEMAQSSH